MPRKSHSKIRKRPSSSTNQSLPIVVIGASAGGFRNMIELLPNLPSESDASYFIVYHISMESGIHMLMSHLQRKTTLTCKLADEGDTIKSKTVYFAVPGFHLIINKNKIKLGNGPDENGFKPSIDVLFRSAAMEYREKVTGIILSGMLEDGVAGMLAIKECGGACIVQDPSEAEYPQLPLAVIDNVRSPQIVTTASLGKVIEKEIKKKRIKKTRIDPDLIAEAAISQKVLSGIDETRKLGKQSLFTCPDCGGTLFAIKEGSHIRYRCFTGHAYSENILLSKQNEEIQSSLWVALRQLEERKKLLEKMDRSATILSRTKALERHSQRIKDLLFDLQKLSNEAEEKLAPSPLKSIKEM